MHTPTLDLPHFDVPLLQYLVQAAFPDRALCIETLERFAHDHGFQISIRTSKGPITYLCCRKGRHIAMSRNPPASVSSYLSFTNCPYSLKLIQQSESRFVLNIVKSHHNHAPFPYGFEPPKPNTNTNTNTNTSTTSIAAAAAGDGGSNKRPRSGSEWLAWESCSTPRDDEHDLGDARPVSKQMFPADGRHIRAHSPAGSSASMVTNATAVRGLLSLSLASSLAELASPLVPGSSIPNASTSTKSVHPSSAANRCPPFCKDDHPNHQQIGAAA